LFSVFYVTGDSYFRAAIVFLLHARFYLLFFFNYRKFEDLAIGVLKACYEHDEVKTRELLTRELPMWGRSSCVLLALKADSKRFISHPACQSLSNYIWMGSVNHHSNTFVKVKQPSSSSFAT
jgi:hypothetical protein